LYVVAWVVLATVVAYWSRFFFVILFSTEANRNVLRAAFLCFAVVVAGFFYLMVYLPFVIKLKDPEAWSVYCPRVIPCMILSSILGFIFLIRGTWPVWGLLAPLVLAIETMGLLFSLHLIPWKSAGGVVYV
jgi:hypothetical protein